MTSQEKTLNKQVNELAKRRSKLLKCRPDYANLAEVYFGQEIWGGDIQDADMEFEDGTEESREEEG